MGSSPWSPLPCTPQPPSLGEADPPEDSQLAVSAPGAVCRRKRRGKGWGQAQWPPRPRPWGLEKQARIRVSCSQESLLPNRPPPPCQGHGSQIPGNSYCSSFLHFPQVRICCRVNPEAHLFTVHGRLNIHSESTILSGRIRKHSKIPGCHCHLRRQRGWEEGTILLCLQCMAF